VKYSCDSLSQETAWKCILLGQRSLNTALKKGIKYGQIALALEIRK